MMLRHLRFPLVQRLLDFTNIPRRRWTRSLTQQLHGPNRGPGVVLPSFPALGGSSTALMTDMASRPLLTTARKLSYSSMDAWFTSISEVPVPLRRLAWCVVRR